MRPLLSPQVGSSLVSQMPHFIAYPSPRKYSLSVKKKLTFFSILTGEREEEQRVCAGKEFRLPVYSTSRMVTFTPDSEGQRRVLLDKIAVS